MSGHSHFATIKRQKESKDAAKSNLFGKLSKMISIAIKSGGGANPDMNFKLRVAIDKARENNMPKDNIDRILKSAEDKANSLEEITYEGFGPLNTFFVVETATDNKNRTAQEIKNIFEKHGGSMGGPNSVLYNFDSKGFMLVKKMDGDTDMQILSLIDMGVEDVVEVEDGMEVYTQVESLSSLKDKIVASGMDVLRVELIKKPKNFVEIDEAGFEKLSKLVDAFDSHDDVQRVHTNF